jgi:preprotein translocase subunit SecY
MWYFNCFRSSIRIYMVRNVWSPCTIGAGNAILIILQLVLASVITMLLDDMMTKGYGIGNSGTSLFIAINMAETVFGIASHHFIQSRSWR